MRGGELVLQIYTYAGMPPFSQAFFESAIKLFQRDNQLQNIVMTDADARNQAIRHFFSRALREARDDNTKE